MYSKLNTKQGKRFAKRDFFVGHVKGEVKKVRALWNRANRRNRLNSEQVDTTTLRKICCQIPFNQDILAAEARGEQPEYKHFNSVYMVKIL